jgi:UDP-N-acetylmuramoylalanine--D-glutamate ligase
VLRRQEAEGWGQGAGGRGRVILYDASPGAETEARITSDGSLVLGGEALAHVSDIHLPGAHSRANALAAAALARSFGVAPAQIAAALRGFAGVEHRLELVREIDGVRYVNDTTATNPAAALAALAAIDTPIVLIAGGADKELEFAALGRAIAGRVKALVLLKGSATARLNSAIADCRLQIAEPNLQSTIYNLQSISGPYGDFAEAIRAARGLAAAGDTVLLSPGCASFGMFRNEFHRGEEFRRIVEGLAPEDDQQPSETETA